MTEHVPNRIARGHEFSGVRPTGLLIGLIIFFLFIAVALAGSWLAVRSFGVEIVGGRLTDAARFPAPGIEPNQALDRQRLMQAQERSLESYCWAEETHRFAVVPIERAIELFSEEDLDGLDIGDKGQAGSDPTVEAAE